LKLFVTLTRGLALLWFAVLFTGSVVDEVLKVVAGHWVRPIAWIVALVALSYLVPLAVRTVRPWLNRA
jgi:hypothetical protein